MNKLFEFFQEDNGGYSMARLIVFMMAALYFIQGVSQIWREGHMTMGWQDIASVLGPFLIKAEQKRFEEKLPTPNPSQEGNKSVGNPNSEIQNPKS